MTSLIRALRELTGVRSPSAGAEVIRQLRRMRKSDTELKRGQLMIELVDTGYDPEYMEDVIDELLMAGVLYVPDEPYLEVLEEGLPD